MATSFGAFGPFFARFSRRLLCGSVALAGHISAQELHLEESVFAEATEAWFEAGGQLASDGMLARELRSNGTADQSAAAAYGDELKKCARLTEQLLRDQDFEDERSPLRWVDLTNLDHALELADEALQSYFSDVRDQFLEGALPEVFLERHDASVLAHQASHEMLMALLGDLREAGSSFLPRKEALEMLGVYFETHPVETTHKLANNPVSDPIPSRDPVIHTVDRAELGLSPEGYVLPKVEVPPLAVQAPPEAADTAETIDIIFTPEITSLAAGLENDPLKIFNWVRQNIRFDPYVGSRRGAAETLRLRAGNDTDQASLLMALLRVSDIPCRYTTGMVQMSAEATANWLGVSNPSAAGSLLATAGMEGVTITNGSTIESIRCRRVWVEALVPYSNYRGTGPADGELLWIRLDPAFKAYDNHFGRDVITESTFNPDTLLSTYFASPDPNTILTRFEEAMANGLADLDPGATFEGNLLRHEIAAAPLTWLPITIPNKILSIDDTWSILPADRRYRIRFLISGEGATLDHSLTLPAIAGKQVTLSYIGATAADQTLIDASGGFFGVSSPSLVNVKPQLRVDGCVIATGTGAVTLGKIQSSQVFFTDAEPGGRTDSISNRLIAGNYEGIAIGTGRIQVDAENPDLKCTEEFTGGFLHRLGMRYLELNDHADRRTAKVANARLWKGVSIAILSQQIKVAFSGTTPLTFRYAGLSVDADRAGATPFAANGSNINYAFGRIRGAQSSQNENIVFELNLGRESVSTIKILSLASLLDIPLLEINSANASTLIPQLTHRTATINDVITQINSGKIVTIPRDSFSYFDWFGTGYIQLDPINGTGGYIIDGGISGGATAEEEDKKPGCEKVSSIVLTPPGGVYSQCQKEPVEITVTLVSYDEECEVVGSRTERKTIVPADLAPGPYKFPFGGPGDCGCAKMDASITIKASPILYQDMEGRTPVAGYLEIAPPTGGPENIRCRIADPPPSPMWTATRASPPSQTGADVLFSVPVPSRGVSNLLPALVQMLTPPPPALIKFDSASPICGEDVQVVPFSTREFEFGRETSKGPAGGRAADAGEDLGTTLQGLYQIYRFLEDSEERMAALKSLSRTMRGPVAFEPSTKFAITLKDKIEEDPKSNFVVYILDIGGNAEAGVGIKFPVLTTAFVGVPPPLAEAAIEVIFEGKVVGRLSGIAEFHRGRGWIKAIYPQAVAAINVSVGLGARATLLSGLGELSVSASTGVQGVAKARPRITGRNLRLPIEFQAEIGGLTAGYKVGTLWGYWESTGSWKLYEPRKFPEMPITKDIFSLPLP